MAPNSALLLFAAALVGFAAAAAEVQMCRSRGSPSPATILAPSAAGSYPVVVFLHGFMLSGTSTVYSSMLQDIARMGFIVVAPQLEESMMSSDATPQIHEAQEFIEWLEPELGPFMSLHCSGLESTSPNMKQLVAMGHSKGGKIAFALARGIDSNISSHFSAVIGLDPVDGASGESTVPPVLNGTHFELPYPSLLVGSGLGPDRKLLLPPCAPRSFGYMAFFNSSSAPVFAFSARKDGHMDFLDDGLWGLVGLMEAACRSGSRKPRARAVASQVTVAFLKAVLHGDCSELDMAIQGASFVGKLGSLCGGSAAAENPQALKYSSAY